MARTRVWDENEPAGALAANQIDNSARALKIDIRELLNQMIGVAEATALLDPVINANRSLNTLFAAAGSVAVVRTVPWFDGERKVSTETGTVTLTRNKFVITGVTALATLFVPIDLPVGVIITRARVLVQKNDAGHLLTMNFYEMGAGADITATNIPTPGNSASPQWAPSAIVAITTVVDRSYGFEVVANNANVSTATELGFYAFQIQYTSATSALR